VLQVGNAKPEIQKIVDALGCIKTKVIFAVCVDWHQSQLCSVVFFRQWIFYLFTACCMYKSKTNLPAVSTGAPVILNAKDMQLKLW